MAMTGAAMAQAVIEALDAAGKYPGLDQAQLDAVRDDMEIAYQAMIDYIKDNAVVKTTLDSGLNSIFTTGVPVPNDGGANLQLAWSTDTGSGAKDTATGDPGLLTGGIE